MGKYLGHLKLRFDDKGDLISYEGNPILLNSTYAQNPAILRKVEAMSGIVKNFSKVCESISFCYLPFQTIFSAINSSTIQKLSSHLICEEVDHSSCFCSQIVRH